MDDEILSVVRKSREDALQTSHAAVLAFNVEKNNWDALHAGIATVFILVNRKQNTVRICAATDDKQVWCFLLNLFFFCFLIARRSCWIRL